jgi:cytochrome c biogenesis protein CcdA
VLGLALAVAAIALPDSINPSLILTDIYLAAGPHPRRRTAMFAIAVFVVTALGGVLLAAGVADLVSSLLPSLSVKVKYWLFVVGGISLCLGATVIWIKRRELAARRRLPTTKDQAAQSAVALGAGIAGVELLTAFPYFAAIGIVVGSGVSAPQKVFLLGLYNLIYVLPLIGITIACAVMGAEAADWLGRIRDRALSRWPFVAAPLAAAVGLGLIIFGVSGIAARDRVLRIPVGNIPEPSSSGLVDPGL